MASTPQRATETIEQRTSGRNESSMATLRKGVSEGWRSSIANKRTLRKHFCTCGCVYTHILTNPMIRAEKFLSYRLRHHAGMYTTQDSCVLSRCRQYNGVQESAWYRPGISILNIYILDVELKIDTFSSYFARTLSVHAAAHS
jgi:hypothetical protein